MLICSLFFRSRKREKITVSDCLIIAITAGNWTHLPRMPCICSFIQSLIWDMLVTLCYDMLQFVVLASHWRALRSRITFTSILHGYVAPEINKTSKKVDCHHGIALMYVDGSIDKKYSAPNDTYTVPKLYFEIISSEIDDSVALFTTSMAFNDIDTAHSKSCIIVENILFNYYRAEVAIFLTICSIPWMLML